MTLQHLLRTLDDALSLRAHLLGRPRVVVVGAGFLGTEIAAVARGMGLDVTLVDPRPAPMQPHLGDRIGAVVADLHTDHGTSLRCSVGVRVAHLILLVHFRAKSRADSLRIRSSAESRTDRKQREGRGRPHSFPG